MNFPLLKGIFNSVLDYLQESVIITNCILLVQRKDVFSLEICLEFSQLITLVLYVIK